MSVPRRRPAVRALCVAALVVLGVIGPAAGSASASDATVPVTTIADDGLLTLPSSDAPDSTDVSPPTTNDFLDLERELSDCVGNSNPKPGCGRAPVRNGDRGSPIQWTVFAVMLGGIGFIGWRIVRSSRRIKPDGNTAD